MRKVLFVASVVKLHIMVFHIPYLKWFKENNYKTHVSARNDYENVEDCEIPYCDEFFDLKFERNPLKIENFNTYNQLKEIISSEEYDIIHCHTPIGGVLTRLATRKTASEKTKVIYTAHGFHFFKGAPLKNWIIYYPIERFLARYTDILITINKEDYNIAKNFKAKNVVYVPGVGINLEKFKSINVKKAEKRRELNVSIDAFTVVSVGELSKRKNHEVIIRALSKLNNKDIVYIICGEGDLHNYLYELATSLKVNVKFLGFRKDVYEVCKAADLFAFPSYQEGLPVALMEGMAAELPVVCSKIRGNVDLIESDKGGYLIEPNDVNGFSDKIDFLFKNRNICENMGDYNKESVKSYDVEIINEKMQKIYSNN